MSVQTAIDLLLVFFASLYGNMNNGPHPDGDVPYHTISAMVLTVEAIAEEGVFSQPIGAVFNYDPDTSTTSLREHLEAAEDYLRHVKDAIGGKTPATIDTRRLLMAEAYRVRGAVLPLLAGNPPTPPVNQLPWHP